MKFNVVAIEDSPIAELGTNPKDATCSSSCLDKFCTYLTNCAPKINK